MYIDIFVEKNKKESIERITRASFSPDNNRVKLMQETATHPAFPATHEFHVPPVTPLVVVPPKNCRKRSHASHRR